MLYAIGQINDLCILAAYLYRHIGLRMYCRYRVGNGNHFLYERYTHPICQRQSARARDHSGKLEIAKLRTGCLSYG